MERRTFMKFTAAAGAALMLNPFESFALPPGKKIKLALVGTGARGSSLWGKSIVNTFGDVTEFVGLSDINPGRLEYVKKMMGVGCPTFSNFEQMLKETKPDYVIVTTVDATHDDFIVKALDMGVNVITEKPMTTDEIKCKRILDAETRSGKNG